MNCFENVIRLYIGAFVRPKTKLIGIISRFGMIVNEKS